MSGSLEKLSPKPRLVWKDNETRVFLKSWKDHMHINRMLKNGCSKQPLYYAVAKDLQKHGYHRSMREIYFKMKNLGKNFRKLKRTTPVNEQIDFKYYKEVDELLKMETEILSEGKPSAEPHIVHAVDQDRTSFIMEKIYNGDTSRRSWGNEEMIKAIAEVINDKKSIHSTAQKYGIPRPTLSAYLKESGGLRESKSKEESSVEENVLENSTNVQVIRLSVPDGQNVSDLNLPSYTVITCAEPEVQNEPEVVSISQPESSSSNSQKPLENILSDFYQEFERSNRQLEKNDAAMLELFKEQNDIFRTQTTLLMKLLLK